MNELTLFETIGIYCYNQVEQRPDRRHDAALTVGTPSAPLPDPGTPMVPIATTTSDSLDTKREGGREFPPALLARRRRGQAARRPATAATSTEAQLTENRA